jgi:hypothetical protein
MQTEASMTVGAIIDLEKKSFPDVVLRSPIPNNEKDHSDSIFEIPGCSSKKIEKKLIPKTKDAISQEVEPTRWLDSSVPDRLFCVRFCLRAARSSREINSQAPHAPIHF